MIDVEGLDGDARAAVARATELAGELDAAQIGTEHLLLGLLLGDGVAADALAATGATAAAVRAKVAEASGNRRRGGTDEALDPTPRAMRAIARARWHSHREKAEAVGTAHLLMGVLDIEGTAGQVLRGVGVDLGRLRSRLTEDVAAPGTPPQPDPVTDTAARCPHCGVEVEELSFRLVRATGEDGRSGDAVVFACRACGAVLGASRARD